MTRHARTVPVLMYHHVSTSPGMITVSPAHFAAQMAYLARAGYRTLGGAQLARYLAGEAVPARSLVLTFDDGYLDNWVHAHPVLARHGFTALNFLVTGWIGEGEARPHAGTPGPIPELLDHRGCEAAIENGEADRAVLRWSEIEAMRRAGTFEFHSHTHSHIRWDQATATRDDKRAGLKEDLLRSRAVLTARFGAASDHLCWPQGYFDNDYLDVARAAGFRHFHTVEMGQNRSGRVDGEGVSVHRLEVRDRPHGWLASRLWVHTRPWLSRAYLAVKR